MYKIKTINEIHDVLLIKLIIKVKVIDWNKIVKLDFNGDFRVVKVSDKIKFIIKINLIKIQCIF